MSREKLIQMQQVLRAKERDAQMMQAQYEVEALKKEGVKP